MKANEDLYVGIDVSKDRLDIAIAGKVEKWEMANDFEGISKLSDKMAQIKPTMIVMEASGGFERHVLPGIFHKKYVLYGQLSKNVWLLS